MSYERIGPKVESLSNFWNRLVFAFLQDVLEFALLLGRPQLHRILAAQLHQRTFKAQPIVQLDLAFGNDTSEPLLRFVHEVILPQ